MTQAAPTRTELTGIRVLDSVYTVRTRSAEAAEQLRRQWVRCLTDPGAGGEGQELLAADSTLPLPREVLLRLTFVLNERAMHDLAGRAIMLHAAGLSCEDRVLVLVAPSGTGKTTAACHLGRSLGYVTDETVAVRLDGSVVPFPKPLAVVDPEEPDLKVHRSPDDLGLRHHATDLRLGPVVLLDRREAGSCGRPRLEPVPLLHAMRELVPQTSALTALSRPLLTLAQRLESSGGVHRLVYEEIDEAEPLLLALLRTDQTSASRCQLRDDLRPHAGPGVLDAVGLGDETLVLHEQGQFHLGPLGSLVWREWPGRTVEDLARLAAEALGPHPEQGSLVARTVDDLVRQGLLAREGQSAALRLIGP